MQPPPMNIHLSIFFLVCFFQDGLVRKKLRAEEEGGERLDTTDSRLDFGFEFNNLRGIG